MRAGEVPASYLWGPANTSYYFHIIDRSLAAPIIASLFGGTLCGTGALDQKRKSGKRVWIALLGGLALLWVLACGGLFAVMRQSPETFARVMARVPGPVAFLVLPFESLWMRARAGKLQVGDPAPDFSLMKLDKSSQIQLSALTARRQPVVLVFGSYT